MITDEMAEAALDYLTSTDDEYAKARGHMLATEYLIKKMEALVFLESEGNIEQRKAHARVNEGVLGAVEDYNKSVYEYHRIDAARKTKMLTIEVWRSQESSRRSGNI